MRIYIETNFPETKHDKAAFRRERDRLKKISRQVKKLCVGRGRLSPKEKRKLWEAAANKDRMGAKAHHKCRAGAPGRTALCPQIREELFAWFIDTIENVKGRIASHMLLEQATTIAADFRAWVQSEIEAGRLEPHTVIRIPKICRMWLTRWRKQFALTWRTVNLRYKISKSKLYRRIELFFQNLFKVRWLHYYLNGEQMILCFSNADQKPLWFTTSHQDKTIAQKGSKTVVVVENVPMTRLRFSPMTRWCWPKRPLGDKKKIAVLFRGTGKNNGLEVPPNVLLQWGPKGSYRTEHTHEYYDWILTPSLTPEQQTLHLLDWFAPNLDEELHEKFTANNDGGLMFPGSVTDYLQTNDTHGHQSYNACFKRRETHSAMVQLRAGARMPCSSKQTVLDRSVAAWDDLNHSRIRFGFVENMIASDLHGNQDHLIASKLAPIWTYLNLKNQREEIGKEIKERVESGELTSWHDYKKPGFLVEAPQTFAHARVSSVRFRCCVL